jgi:GntR family transcriptional repressor for pyruvate dehydrogenase complex
MDAFIDIGITRERLSEQVARHIQQLILDGKISEGERLPSDRDLSKKFGVSRTVAREAIALLQDRGLVRVISGSGTYVSSVDPDVVKQSIGMFMSGRKNRFRDLMETRLFFEVNVAGLAAERATDEDVKNIEKALLNMKDALPNINEGADQLDIFVQADITYHRYLAEATYNSLLPVLLASFADLLLEFSRHASSQPGAPEEAIEHHKEILEYVVDRDVDGARRAMLEHMKIAFGHMQTESDQFQV